MEKSNSEEGLDHLKMSINSSSEEGFIGLPLNSQGELIQLQPDTRYGFSEMDMMSNLTLNLFSKFSMFKSCSVTV